MKLLRKLSIFIFIITIVSLIAVSCSSPAQTPSSSKAPIKIGYITNMNFVVHKETLSAAKMAVDEINASGGILGRPIELVVEDDLGKVPNAVSAYKKLILTDNCRILIMGEGSESTMANQETGAELYKDYPHISVSVGAAQPDITMKVANNYDKYKFFFRHHHNAVTTNMNLLCDGQSTMMKSNNLKKLAHLEEDADWNKPSRNGGFGNPPMKEMFKNNGLDVVYYGEVAIGEKMFFTIFDEIARSGAEAIFCQFAYTDTVTCAKQWASSAAKDIPINFTGAGGASLKSYWGSTGGACLGSWISDPEGNYPVTPNTVPFVEKLRSKYGVGLTWMSQYPYEFLYMLKRACEKTGTADDTEALIKALEQVEIPENESVHGRIKYGTTGINTHGMLVGPGYYLNISGQWQGDGNVVILWPQEIANKINPGKGYISPEKLRTTVK